MNSVQIVGLIVLLTVIACAMLYFKRKEDADDLNPVKSGAPTDVDSYVASHGEPLDVVVANPLAGNELGSVVLVYADRLVVGGEEVPREIIDDITFNNAAVPYINSQYQLVVTTRSDARPVVRMALGGDAEWASQVTAQLSECVEKDFPRPVDERNAEHDDLQEA